MAATLNINLHTIQQIVSQYNPLDIALALVHHATLSTVDMTNDMILDPDYVKENGLPNRAEMTKRIHGWVTDVMPEILGDEIPSAKTVGIDGETKLEGIFRALVNEHIDQNPGLLALNYQPR